jgi:hypothetical protein
VEDAAAERKGAAARRRQKDGGSRWMEVVAVVTGTHLLAAARRGVPRAAEANLYAAALGTGSADIVFFFFAVALSSGKK